MSSHLNINSRAENDRRVQRLVAHRLRSILDILEQPGVTEICINSPTEVWMTVEGRRRRVEGLEVPEIESASVLRELASARGNTAVAETPEAIVYSKVPGFRYTGVLAPTATKGTALSIRKHSPRVLSLDDYVHQGSIPENMAQVLRAAVVDGENMLVTGSTDTGKTTLLNAISREIPHDQRVLSIEDTRELQLMVPNWVPLETNAQKGIHPTMLVELAMRFSPDRILQGEIRGVEAAAFLEVANTGHHGCAASLHCNNAFDALARLEILVLRANLGWPLQAIKQQIASTINLVVHMTKAPDGRRVLNQIARVNSQLSTTGGYQVEFLYQRARRSQEVLAAQEPS